MDRRWQRRRRAGTTIMFRRKRSGSIEANDATSPVERRRGTGGKKVGRCPQHSLQRQNCPALSSPRVLCPGNLSNITKGALPTRLLHWLRFAPASPLGGLVVSPCAPEVPLYHLPRGFVLLLFFSSSSFSSSSSSPFWRVIEHAFLFPLGNFDRVPPPSPAARSGGLLRRAPAPCTMGLAWARPRLCGTHTCSLTCPCCSATASGPWLLNCSGSASVGKRVRF